MSGAKSRRFIICVMRVRVSPVVPFSNKSYSSITGIGRSNWANSSDRAMAYRRTVRSADRDGWDGHDATARRQAATWRRPTTWRPRRAGGAHVRERGPILACLLADSRFGVYCGDSAGG